MVQWLGLRASTTGGTGSIPGQGIGGGELRYLMPLSAVKKNNHYPTKSNHDSLPSSLVSPLFELL